MIKERKVLVGYKNPRAVGEAVKNFLKAVEDVSPENPIRVYIKKSDSDNFSIHMNPDCSDNPPILKISGKEQAEDNSEKYGKIFGDFFKSSEEISEMITNKHICEVVGIVDNRYIISLEVNSEVKDVKPSKSEIEELEENLIKDEICGEASISQRREAFEKYGVDLNSSLYRDLLKKVKPRKEGEVLRPEVIYEPQGKEDFLIKDILTHIICGNNIILEGAKSTGKNVAWETVGWLLNAEIVMLQCDGAMTKAQMLGHQSTDNSMKDAITEEVIEEAISEGKKIFSSARKKMSKLIKAILWSLSPTLRLEKGPITEALIKASEGNGVILLLDEMNLSDPNTLAGVINSIADGHTPEVFVTGLGKVPVVRENLIIGATQNNCGGDYLGTQSQNDATMSRFVCLTVEPTKSIAKVLRRAVPEASTDDINQLDACYKKFVELALSNQVSESCLNLRGFISALRVMSRGVSYESAVTQGVVNTCSNPDDREILISGIEQVSEF